MGKGSQGGAWATAFCILEFWGGFGAVPMDAVNSQSQRYVSKGAEKFLTLRFKMPYFGACTGFLAKPDSPLPWKN